NVARYKNAFKMAPACDFKASDTADRRKIRGNFLSNLAGRTLQSFRQFKANRRSGFAELKLWRLFQHNGNVNRVFLANVLRESVLELLEESEIHVASIRPVRNVQYRKRRQGRSKPGPMRADRVGRQPGVARQSGCPNSSRKKLLIATVERASAAWL